jgi:ABC-type lipoprotein export system ATPase subunit
VSRPVLELDRVSRVHGTGPTAMHALREVSLSVSAGELVAVMGPSGSGNSTLLAQAGGLDAPSGGPGAGDRRCGSPGRRSERPGSPRGSRAGLAAGGS